MDGQRWQFLKSPSTFSGSSSMTVPVAICSFEPFFLTNGTNVFEIRLGSGFGSWMGLSSNNASLLAKSAGQSIFDVAVSDNGALISHSTLFVIRNWQHWRRVPDALPLFGDSLLTGHLPSLPTQRLLSTRSPIVSNI
ncbi:hypothetical protein EDD15DRAFT_2284095 [Pisolithus albus]|nr:hypothetical protein EDD15DRAFT_2284095 [Pisolithus albus]